MKEVNYLLLMQIADSAFPVGGFAYSSGMESAVKHGLVSNEENLREYMITFSEQILAFDFPFISSSYHYDPMLSDYEELIHLSEAYPAMLLNPPIRKAGCIVGKNWLKICIQISDKKQLTQMEAAIKKHNLPYDFPVIYGLCMNAMGFSLQQTYHLFFYMALRDQISSLIRLGVAGPTRAHIELQSIMESFEDRINYRETITYHDAHKTGYLMELAQLSHEKVYSKLFQN